MNKYIIKVMSYIEVMNYVEIVYVAKFNISKFIKDPILFFYCLSGYFTGSKIISRKFKYAKIYKSRKRAEKHAQKLRKFVEKFVEKIDSPVKIRVKIRVEEYLGRQN